MESLPLRWVPRFLRTARCPKCESNNVRPSRVLNPEQDRQLGDGLFVRWLRCRECGYRFRARDAFLVQLWLSGAIAVISTLATLFWVYSSQPGLLPPTQFEPNLTTMPVAPELFAPEEPDAEMDKESEPADMASDSEVH
ncbi:hypothetical protein Thiowin_02103 [Thiorhodovibrio winogradskyi]|uniref:Uncharacterized protein n=1 Tax=Thiorhodovibrio winogradskyi TaxID=77007 RepID=A0ABZ0S9A7_9GAMM